MLNNFIYAKKKSLFEETLNNGEVLDEAIVFIEDTKEIWNHGTYFAGKDYLIPVTYSELKVLKDTSKLIPNQKYRIIDYETILKPFSGAIKYRTMGHVFDIVVEALSENQLSEDARAMLHDGDEYFKYCNLNVWKLKYCLDNDSSRFQDVDTENSKGVIYYMKDESNNECQYDFKNILHNFYNHEPDIFYYTFTLKESKDSTMEEFKDFSVEQFNPNYNNFGCYNNSIKPHNLENEGCPGYVSIICTKNDNEQYKCSNNVIKSDCTHIKASNGMALCVFDLFCKHIFGNLMTGVHFGTLNQMFNFDVIEDSTFEQFVQGVRIQRTDDSGKIIYGSGTGLTIKANNVSNAEVGGKWLTLKPDANNRILNVFIKSGTAESNKNTDIDLSNTGNYITTVERNVNGDVVVYSDNIVDVKKSKLDTLVSGTNIRTINGNSLLGDGDISISANAITKVNGILDIKNVNDLNYVWNSLTENGESATYIISDDSGKILSPNSNTVYIDNKSIWLDLFYRANGNALKNLVESPEAYYNVTGSWTSQSIGSYINLPKYHLQTAKVGDLITIFRQEFDAAEFYKNYIDYSSINFRDSLDEITKGIFNMWLSSLNISSSLSDGEIIEQMIIKGLIYSCSTNPNDTGEQPTPLAVDGKVIMYTAQITPNTQHVYSGEFWPGNMTGPGIYSYVTIGLPEGTDSGEVYTGYVAPDGAQTLIAVQNPYKVFTRPNINSEWTKITPKTDKKTKYGYGTMANHMLTTGICAYTPDNIDGILANWSIFVDCSADVDSGGYYHFTQTAICRDNPYEGEMWQRFGWYKENEAAAFTPWKKLTLDTKDWELQSSDDYARLKITYDDSAELYIGMNNQNELFIGPNNTSGIKISNAGEVTMSSSVSASSFYQTSDINKKNIIENITIPIEKIAEAPSVKFTWKYGISGNLVGTIALYWKNVLPEVVQGEEGTYSVEYAILATINSISLAKKVVELENRINQLEQQIANLYLIINNNK